MTGISGTGIRGILLDIEGTTTPIQFVYDVLFPFVRLELDAYLRVHDDEPQIQEILQALQREHADDAKKNSATPQWQSAPLAYVNWLMDQDRKSTALKALQGRIWYDGYHSGRLRGQVFPDVPPALDRWQKLGLDVRIFSSGSELAQRLLFANSESGDLTRFLRGYFDTTIGSKTDPSSYGSIAAAFGFPPEQIVFVSDATRELDAAQHQGLVTLLCRRPGNPPQGIRGHRTIFSFDEI